MTKYPNELLRFVTPITYTEEGRLVITAKDKEQTYFSNFYDPVLAVNIQAQEFLNRIKRNEIEGEAKSLSSDAFILAVNKTPLKYNDKFVYLICQLVVLEMVSLQYSIEEDTSLMNYINESTINNTYKNIKYLIAYFSGKPEYNNILLGLEQMLIDVGYLKQQAPVIKGVLHGRL